MNDDMVAIPFVRRTSNERVDGTLTVKIDIDPQYKLQFLRMFPEIGAAGALTALARMTKEASVTPPAEPKTKPGPLCVMACAFCEDPVFWTWVITDSVWAYPCNNAEQAKAFILDICGIKSRKELDARQTAAAEFHKFIREPFLKWKAKQ